MSPAERKMLAGFLATVLGVSVLLLAVFAAWGRATDHSAGSRRSRLLFTGWGGIVERQVFTDLVREFERRNPDIRVDYRPVPRDYVTKLKLMFAGHTPPDVFYIPDGDFPGFAAAGQLTDLQPLVDRSPAIRAGEIWEPALRRYRWSGRVFGRGDLYALPKDLGPTVMYVNQDLLRASGIPMPSSETPMTWGEAVNFWRRLTIDRDGDGRPDQWGTTGMVLEAAVWSNGGEFLSADGRRFVMPDDPRALEGAEWLVGLQAREHVAPQERQRQSIPVDTLFLTGRLATFVGGRWMVPQFRKAAFAWDVVPIPVSPRTHREAGWSGSVGLAISPSSPHRAEAWRLIEFLTGPEGQAVQAATGFQLPNQRRLSESAVFLQPGEPPAHSRVFLAAAAAEQGGPPTRTPDNEWWDAVIRALGPAYRGESTATEAVRKARGEVQAALDRSWGKLR